MNLVEGLSREIERCTALRKQYEEIGPAGGFAKAMITAAIEEAHKAIGSGDIVTMMSALENLRDFKE